MLQSLTRFKIPSHSFSLIFPTTLMDGQQVRFCRSQQCATVWAVCHVFTEVSPFLRIISRAHCCMCPIVTQIKKSSHCRNQALEHAKMWQVRQCDSWLCCVTQVLEVNKWAVLKAMSCVLSSNMHNLCTPTVTDKYWHEQGCPASWCLSSLCLKWTMW